MSETTPQTEALTAEDIRDTVERAYTPEQVELVFRPGKLGPWHRSHMRPTEGGSSGHYPDGVFRQRDNDKKGMNIRLAGYEGDQRVWERSGHIAWRVAETLIREAATPATIDALKEAVIRGALACKEGRMEDEFAASRDAGKAWTAIIRPTEEAPAEPEVEPAAEEPAEVEAKPAAAPAGETLGAMFWEALNRHDGSVPKAMADMEERGHKMASRGYAHKLRKKWLAAQG